MQDDDSPTIQICAEDQLISELQTDLPDGAFIERRSSPPTDVLRPGFSEPVTLIAAVTVAWVVRYIVKRLLPSGELIVLDMSGRDVKIHKEKISGQSTIIVKTPDGKSETYNVEVGDEDSVSDLIQELISASTDV